MNKTRILGGFSLVEMMLLLLIVSLMIASGVAVISKRHVKVPRLAMHGAYMCYYKNGNLHAERYVGSGLTKKIFDEDVAECVFTPPEKVAYLHIQATGGGGGGGDSGYTGGSVVQRKSAVEKISPFGITAGLLELKGIYESSLSALGGTISAYADAKGKKGDAGAGGNLWYIVQECGSGSCLVKRDWKYTGHRDRECKYNYTTKYYTYDQYQYYHTCTKQRSGGGWSASDCPAGKTEEYVSATCGYDTCGTYDWESCSYLESKSTCDRSCSEQRVYCYNKEVSGNCANCTNYITDSDGKKICKSTSYIKTGKCLSGTKYIYCSNGQKQCWSGGRKYLGTYENCKYYDDYCYDSSHTCKIKYNVPYSSDSCSTYSEKLTVNTTDYYAKDTDQYPNYIQKENDPPADYLADANRTKAERKLVRDKGEQVSICNYGNPTKFTGVADGIFGSFVSSDGVGVNCTTAGIAEAFGDDIFPVTTSLNPVSAKFNAIDYEVSSKEVYGGDGLLFDRSEEFDNPYGTVCYNTVGGSCGTGDKNGTTDSQYKNPITGETFQTKEYIDVGCNMGGASGADISDSYYTQDEDECSGKGNFDSLGGRITCSNCSSSKYITTSSACVEPSNIQQGSYCMYSYGDGGGSGWKGTESNTEIGNGDGSSYTKGECMYRAEVAEGGRAGVGTQCTVGPVAAGIGLSYQGFSSVLPGIRGSDVNCTTNGKAVKVLYTESEWKNQPSCYAENGTNSVGSATVTLNGETCTANIEAPTLGKGARKEATGATDVIPGGSVENGNGKNGTTDGSVKGGTSVGDQHVGYIVSGKGENYKYSYQYTWDTNYMQYGEGGDAGEYKVKIVRAVKDKALNIVVGRGGAAGANGTGASGQNGGDTVIEGVLTAKGGAGGPGGLTTPVEQMPYFMGTSAEGFDYSRGQSGTDGGKHNNLNIKSNIMNLVLPVDNFALQKWVMASGEGGNGGGSQNYCWASEWIKWFEGQELSESIYEDQFDCNRATDWSATPAAENGIDGLVLIRW